MPGPDSGCAHGAADGGDRAPRPARAAGPEALRGDGAATGEAARDMSGSLSSGVPEEMPQAAQTAGRSRVTRLLPRATDRAGCRERRESDERREAPERTKYVWPEREGSPAERQREVREGTCPQQEPPQDGPRLPDDRGDARRLRLRDGGGGGAHARRAPGRTAHPDVPETGRVARTVRERREGIPGYLDGRPANAYLEGANSLTRSIKRAARGFRNVEYLATAILPGLGGLSFDALACAQS